MPAFIQLHLVDDGPRCGVANWKPVQVPIKMGFNLSLGFSDEAEAHGVPEPPGDQAEAECAEIPERVQDGGMRTQAVQPFARPGKMIRLFPGCR